MDTILLVSLLTIKVASADAYSAAANLSHEMSLQRGGIYHEMKLLQLDALLQHHKGANNAAHRSLRRALQLGQGGGFIRAFLDEGESLLRLLREEYQSILESGGNEECNDCRGFIERLLQASGTDLSRIPHGSEHHKQPVESLTDREKEILAFLAQGASNKEIANRNHVSENTIKFHLKNIYSKLAVSSRVQAITAARQLGIII